MPLPLSQLQKKWVELKQPKAGHASIQKWVISCLNILVSVNVFINKVNKALL